MELEKHSLTPMGNVHICFAVDDNYAPYLKVTINSLLKNCNRDNSYDLIVLHTGLNSESRDILCNQLEYISNICVRLVDVTNYLELLKYEMSGYISIATNYRLLLFSELFLEYDKMIYLDSDVIVEGDISDLYSSDMKGKLIAAVEETGFRQLSYSKKAVFLNDSEPYNVDNYRTDALMMKYPENYFNAGVLLLDLKNCRNIVKLEDVIGILHSKKYFYNDQDVLNIVFDGQVHLLDVEWNYQNNIEGFCTKRPEIYESIYADVRRDSPKIIHFVSSRKPWNCEVALGELFYKYV